MLALIWSLLWCAVRGPRFSRVAARAATLLMCLAIVRQFHYQGPRDHQFPLYARRFEDAKPGQQITIPIYPDPWSMTLTRKDSHSR